MDERQRQVDEIRGVAASLRTTSPTGRAGALGRRELVRGGTGGRDVDLAPVVPRRRGTGGRARELGDAARAFSAPHHLPSAVPTLDAAGPPERVGMDVGL